MFAAGSIEEIAFLGALIVLAFCAGFFAGYATCRNGR